MIIAKVTVSQAERAAYLLQTEGGHDEAADALLALANDTDLVMTRDGTDDAEVERLVNAAPHMLAALKVLADVTASNNSPKRIREIALAAIANAEGRADG